MAEYNNIKKKKQLGQFNTTYRDYVLSGFEYVVKNKFVVDPFAGNGDLLTWANDNGASIVKGFDVDESLNWPVRNSFLSPPDLHDYVLLANPPFLLRNKSMSKIVFDQYDVDDLYQAMFKFPHLEEGLVIVPLNFICGRDSASIRNYFFDKFRIIKMNVFEHAVFDDTPIPVCAFHFNLSTVDTPIDTIFFPSYDHVNMELSKHNKWQWGDEPLSAMRTRTKIGRFTVKDIDRGLDLVPAKVKIGSIDSDVIVRNVPREAVENILILYSTDTGSSVGKIHIGDVRDLDIDLLLGLHSSRNIAHLNLPNPPSINVQLDIAREFNEIIDEWRNKYRSMFLPSYRNAGSNGVRKRIPFDDAYGIVQYIINKRKISL